MRYLDFYSRVIIFSKDDEWAEKMGHVLHASFNFNYLGAYETVHHFYQNGRRRHIKALEAVDIAIIDIRTLQLEEIKILKKLAEDLKVFVVDNKFESVSKLLNYGIYGFINNPLRFHAILKSLDQIRKGLYAFDSVVMKEVITKNIEKENQLTDREKEVLSKLHKGLTYQQISKELDIRFETVKTHINTIYGKLGVANKYEAVKYARINNFI